MKLQGRVVVVTGGGHGIGRAICERAAHEGAQAVVVADIDETAARSVAEAIGGERFVCDVARESDVQHLVQETIDRHGGIDLFCSNAGVTVKGGPETADADWQKLWTVNVMSHVYAARAVLPSMLVRGEGYLLQTASAAGLLTEIGSAAYTVTKHAAVGFAEWLSVHYRKRGIRVSCLCPAGVSTDFLDLNDPVHQFLQVSAVTAENVADSVISAIDEERFLILPEQHAQVAEFFASKGQDYDRWLRNFARIHEKLQRQIARQEGSS